MKLIITIFCLAIGASASAQLSNVSLLIESSADPQNPFVDCAVAKAVTSLGAAYSLYRVMDAVPVETSMPSEYAKLRFITQNSVTGKKNIFAVQMRSLDQAKKWQYVAASSGRIFLYSTSVFEEASILNSSTEKLGTVDLINCQ